MIDLRVKGLPTQIEIGGLFFNIKTDFRIWLEFGERIKNKDCTLDDFTFVFKDDIPQEHFAKKLMDFYINKNSTPNYNNSSSENVLDYIQDGEYIVGSFMRVYGIDLTSIEYMHWHLFKALFVSLPDDAKINQIMSMRAYKKSNKDYDQVAKENKQAWKLPSIADDELDEILKQIDEEFYNT